MFTLIFFRSLFVWFLFSNPRTEHHHHSGKKTGLQCFVSCTLPQTPDPIFPFVEKALVDRIRSMLTS
jgi:hypothetical protein